MSKTYRETFFEGNWMRRQNLSVWKEEAKHKSHLIGHGSMGRSGNHIITGMVVIPWVWKEHKRENLQVLSGCIQTP